jgi:hypothetical protein
MNEYIKRRNLSVSSLMQELYKKFITNVAYKETMLTYIDTLCIINSYMF